MTESTAESISHPVAFGAAMLVMFINWMVLGPPDGSWAWVEHIAADLSVLGLMAGVGAVTSRVRGGWLRRSSSAPAVRAAAESIRARIKEVERPHRAAAHCAGFLAAAAAFGATNDATDRPLLMLGAVLGAFVGAQVAVMMSLRPRAESALRSAFVTASAGLNDLEQSALSEELGASSIDGSR